ncbi:ExbD/TolR family protein [Rhodocyclus tenuis]|uniref:Biopolymer transport protein ExbD n=1 Tax=Rhodocyclus tenuis TaxID=1066 RepID=A0A840G758_RHOTE|nr:biopolymer transporter ExbD [Rhodocyclus tenuis]MBB4247715.1 biopolymer transport protein ExbD [Rhodocyclus tenuis]MBK1680988.1 biopolymer transporter ExbD [Rhodocyclus tenuis]
MAFASLTSSRRTPRPEINVVPLVDVMLVMLVIFIITAPLLTHAVKIDLPKASSQPNVTRAGHVEVALCADGSLFWNGESISEEQLPARFAGAAQLTPQPEIHFRGDEAVPYGRVARAMAAAARAGLTRIGFLTSPTTAK